MKNLLKSVEGNIYGLGVYCFKGSDGTVLYVGSGMMNDRLQSHLYNLKRGLYEGTNKDILQKKYNVGDLSFVVLHFSKNNSEYLSGTKEEKMAIQEALEVLEQFYVDMYKDTICNSHKKISKHSSNKNKLSTYKRRMANLGSNNPNCKYNERIICEILWLKLNGYKPKEYIQHYKDISKKYINAIGITKWIHMEPIKPDWIEKEAKSIGVDIASSASDTLASVNA